MELSKEMKKKNTGLFSLKGMRLLSWGCVHSRGTNKSISSMSANQEMLASNSFLASNCL